MNGLKLERIELREIELPLNAPFETSFGTSVRRRILIVRVFDTDGAVGYGECTAPENPFYNPETIETAWLIIGEFIAPMLSRTSGLRAENVGAALSRIRGNRMAIGAVEAAVWDLEAKLAEKPLWQYLGGTQSEVNCGVSIGLQSTPEVLQEKVTRELESGYQVENKARPRC